MSISCRKTGDWKKVAIKLTRMQGCLGKELTRITMEEADMILKKIQDHVYNQDLGWSPLSPNTVMKKGHDLVYLDSTELIGNGLEIRKVRSDTKSTSFMIGASPYKKHSESGLKMSELMLYLEYGVPHKGIPPRPLIRPTFMEVQKHVKNDFKQKVLEIIRGV